MNEEFLHFVQG